MKEIIRAAFVIARRDFTAIIYSKAFIFFLLGPFFPVLVGFAAGNLGGQIAKDVSQPVVGIALAKEEAGKILSARESLSKTLGDSYFARMVVVGDPAADQKVPQSYLAKKSDNLSVVVTGTLAEPVITGTTNAIKRERADIELLAGYAQSGGTMTLPRSTPNIVVESANNDKKLRTVTAQGGQFFIFFLTILLAGMVLSNLVEEKSNKIIEILAASIPMESVFLGKLFAMLGMALLGILVWTTVGLIGFAAIGPDLPNFPTPAVGWPMFIGLCFTYFIMTYLMLGALFLGIGAMAATVREVQTISMPVTMAQLINFFFASYALTKTGEPIEKFATIFPFSSPFAMIGRAALEPALWHHAVAIIGQVLFAILLLRLGVYLFKKNVMKSGSAGRAKDDGARRLFGFIKMPG
ncbi:ABC transporter permease [Sphingorhabdus sp.]|jgi:ABC-2 type transport system permease protein|uniref:ABC transporter permease n=1 Tax=Sphingorhabdus sp. TaxID=1902408 RepID=UPI0037C6A92F